MPRVKRRIEEFETGSQPEAMTGNDPNDDPDENDSVNEILEQADTDQIQEIINNIEGGTKAGVRIERRAPGKATFSMCCEMALDTFKADGIGEIIRRFGGGKYMLRFKDGNGKFAGSKTIDVDERLKGELDNPVLPGSNGDSAKSDALLKELAAKENSTMGVVLQMMQMQSQQAAQALAAQAQQNQANLQMITAAMAQPKSGGLKDFAPILATFTPLIVKLIEGRSQDPTLKAIETMAKVKELFADQSGESGMESLLKSFGPIVAAKLAQQPAAPAPAEPQQVQVDAPANMVPLESPQLPAPNTDDPEMLKGILKSRVLQSIRSYYPALLKAAQKGSHPDSYLEVILDQGLDEAPDAALDLLAEMLAAPNWDREVFGVEALPHPEWFAAFRQAFLDWYSQPPNDAQTEPATEAKPEPVAVPAPEAPKEKAKGGKK